MRCEQRCNYSFYRFVTDDSLVLDSPSDFYSFKQSVCRIFCHQSSANKNNKNRSQELLSSLFTSCKVLFLLVCLKCVSESFHGCIFTIEMFPHEKMISTEVGKISETSINQPEHTSLQSSKTRKQKTVVCLSSFNELSDLQIK